MLPQTALSERIAIHDLRAGDKDLAQQLADLDGSRIDCSESSPDMPPRSGLGRRLLAR